MNAVFVDRSVEAKLTIILVFRRVSLLLYMNAVFVDPQKRSVEAKLTIILVFSLVTQLDQTCLASTVNFCMVILAVYISVF